VQVRVAVRDVAIVAICHRKEKRKHKILFLIDPLHLLSNPIVSITQSLHIREEPKEMKQKKKIDKSLPIYLLLITPD
jgi:hypothetical protein